MPGPARKRESGDTGKSAQSGRRIRKKERGPAKQAMPSSTVREEDLSRLRSLSGQERADVVLEMQRRYGNRRVGQMLDHLARPDIPATVQSAPAAALAPADRETEQDDPNLVSSDLASRIDQERVGGKPLDAETRVDMEASLGQDFGDVRVHTGPVADSLNREVEARAFTTGSDVFFREGTYAPDSSAGKELLAHELTHVVQQRGTTDAGPSRITSPGDAVEKEAASVAENLVARQAEEEEELPLARQEVEVEALAPNPELLIRWVSEVLTPIAEATGALEDPTADNVSLAYENLSGSVESVKGFFATYEEAGDQMLTERMARVNNMLSAYKMMLSPYVGLAPVELGSLRSEINEVAMPLVYETGNMLH